MRADQRVTRGETQKKGEQITILPKSVLHPCRIKTYIEGFGKIVGVEVADTRSYATN